MTATSLSSVGSLQTANEALHVGEDYSIREIWMEQARLLMGFEYFGFAKELLLEAMFHSKVFDDRKTQSKCAVLLAQIYHQEDDTDSAIRVSFIFLSFNWLGYPRISDCSESFVILAGKYSAYG